MKSDVTLAEMSQEYIDELFKSAFKDKKVLDKVRHNFDKEFIERILDPEKFKNKGPRGDGSGRGQDQGKGGRGRKLQPPRPERKIFEKKEYVAELNKLDGRFMMTTFVLGGPLES